MIRRLIILLLIVGCDYAPTEHSHETEIHPLVGTWVKYKNETYDATGDDVDGWILNDTLSHIVGEMHSIRGDTYLNYYKVFDFYSNGTFVNGYSPDTTISPMHYYGGIWMTSGNKITIIYEQEEYQDNNITYIADYEVLNEEMKLSEINSSIISNNINDDIWVDEQHNVNKWISFWSKVNNLP